MGKGIFLVVLILVLIGASYILVDNVNLTGNVVIEDRQRELVFVTKIIDGDTIVANGEHIRLLGMDADERGYDCYKEAKKRLEELILDKEVILERDKTDKDQYDRFLRYIFIGGENINVVLVEEGLAVARFYDDRRNQSEILAAEKSARGSKMGCKWGKIA